MSTLEDVLKTVLYSFTKKESTEAVQPDGSVKKVAIFRHVGWVAV